MINATRFATKRTIFLMCTVFLLAGCGGSDDSADDSNESTGSTDNGSGTTGAKADFIFPFEKGQTWTVCQGYNTSDITHDGNLNYSLDFSLDADAAQGGTACSFATANTSTGQYVYAPADGRIMWHGLDSVPGINVDMTCIRLDETASNGANSILLGHLNFSGFVSTLDQVKQGDLIGVVNAPSVVNGAYAHIHISSHASSLCNDDSIPLNSVFGGSYNFTDNGNEQQWRGTTVSRD
ncbi:MAG: Unknown protein [uncultured Thiotrichaceae bacterium]|uniref:Peptidase M23 domain-containing protein n=1 Tax=uncultured Thiotrichaceae bacterium TaxID=298394 RepID=A0A6S6TUL1_9GAMM|nr:MAG: Unknown protein [uncultured Thiotrichaceae bacterium]